MRFQHKVLLFFLLGFFQLSASKLLETQFVFTKNVAKLIDYIYLCGYSCTFGETYRTYEQALIYSHAHIGILNSNHRNRLAVDLNLFDHKGKYINTFEAWKTFGEYWEKLNKNNEWGGRWVSKDLNHCEMDLASSS